MDTSPVEADWYGVRARAAENQKAMVVQVGLWSRS